MNAIIGMADLLADTELDEDQSQYVDIFRSSGQSLLALINDLLDLSKIEAGNIEIEAIPFLIDETLGEVIQVVSTGAHRKGLELVARIAPDIPPAVGDPTRLKQVLINLLGNAVKFTTSGNERAAILEAGCDAHLTKPIRKADLIEAVRRYGGLPAT